MQTVVEKDYEEMSAKAFEVMKGVVKSNPYAVLGLPRAQRLWDYIVI